MFEYLAQGGWMMWVIAVAAIMLYGLLAERLLYYHWVCRSAEGWDPQKPTGQNRNAQQDRWRHVQHGERVAIIRALITALPLLGLLGTVGGMMASFTSLHGVGNHGAGIGAGISQALLTTQYALALAVPGLLIERWMQSALERVENRDSIDSMDSMDSALEDAI